MNGDMTVIIIKIIIMYAKSEPYIYLILSVRLRKLSGLARLLVSRL